MYEGPVDIIRIVGKRLDGEVFWDYYSVTCESVLHFLVFGRC